MSIALTTAGRDLGLHGPKLMKSTWEARVMFSISSAMKGKSS